MLFGAMAALGAIQAQPPSEQPQAAPGKPAEQSTSDEALRLADKLVAKWKEHDPEWRARDNARDVIRAAGYDCRSVDGIIPDPGTEARGYHSWAVGCDHNQHSFTIENHRGKWIVTPEG